MIDFILLTLAATWILDYSEGRLMAETNSAIMQIRDDGRK